MTNEDPNVNYWKATAEKARKEASDNMRLAAERATEIAELRKEVEQLKRDISKLLTGEVQP